MAYPNATWRNHPFTVGRAYAARESFPGFPDLEFVASIHYVLLHVSYSHYDSSTVFRFQAVGTGDQVSWWWHDDEPDELCLQRFEVFHDRPLSGIAAG